MKSRALGWIHIKFDDLTIKNQSNNELSSSRLDYVKYDELSIKDQSKNEL